MDVDYSKQSKMIERFCKGVFYLGCLITGCCLIYLVAHYDSLNDTMRLIGPVFISGLIFILVSNVFIGVNRQSSVIQSAGSPAETTNIE
jgi:hypothetical protein